MWNSYSTPEQVPGRMADRQAEARARRLAAEAKPSDGRTFWLSGTITAVAKGGTGLLARVRGVRVHRPGVSLRAAHHRP